MSKIKPPIILLSLSVLIVLLSLSTGIFWDNVAQIYKLADWLQQHNLFNWIVPNNLDPGIPLTIPFIHALAWTILGKSLLVSHFLMLPFIFGLLWQIYRLVNYFFVECQYKWWVYAMVISDASLCAIFVLINFEVIQYFLFLGAINAVIRRNKPYLTIFLLFLSFISLRSMMLCGSVFIFEYGLMALNLIDRKSLYKIKTLQPYLIGSIPALTFLIWHYHTKGWVFGNDDSPWASCGTLVNFQGFARNIIVLIHRLIDFGRIYIWAGLIAILWINRHKTQWIDSKFKILILLWISSISILGGTSLFLNNPMGHRYFIANYIVLAVIFSYLINMFATHKKAWFSIIIVCLISGNLWIYPQGIAQGWDASLASLPYYNLRRTMIEKMDSLNIPIEKTASFFPNTSTIESVDLNGDLRSFTNFDGTNQYVFMSRVYNLSDDDYILLERNYTPIEELYCRRINVVLYQHNK
jgi:hypothetical protein